MSDTLELIANLLRKAERTDNEHEAEAFMSRAQTLASRHSIDLAIARAHTAKAEKREEVEEQSVVIGTKGKRGLAQYVRLFLNICEVNDIRCLIAHDSTVVYAMGFPSDIEMVKTLYGSLVVQMVQAGEAYLKSGEYKKDTVYVPGRFKRTTRNYWGGWNEEWVDGCEKPVDGRVARRSFYEGFTTQITARLREAKALAVEEAQQEHTEVSSVVENGQALTSMALVLREKKAEIDSFYGERSKRARGSWKGGRGASGGSHAARGAGREAGRSARLSGQGSLPAGRSRISA
jgi:hypothetical protein